MNRDIDLLERLRQGEQAGLEAVIHQYGGYVAAVIKRTLGPFGVAEDGEELVSDVFVALWQNAGELRDDSNLKYWLAVVARNAALKRLGRVRLEAALEENLPPFLDGETESPAEVSERRQLVRRAVESLNRQDRDIFLRHYFWYQSVAQIARETGMNESTVKTRLRRGREKLKEKLIKEGCEL